MPFFPISDEKITALMSIFCQKRLFSKNKTSTLLKTKCSRVIFSIFYKNPILLCPYLVKKRIFCQNYTILLGTKVNKMPFFSPHTQFILKIRLFFKGETALKSMFCQKTFIPSKKLCSHVIFF